MVPQSLDHAGDERGRDADAVRHQVREGDAASGEPLGKFDQHAEGEGAERQVGSPPSGRDREQPERHAEEGEGMGFLVGDMEDIDQIGERPKEENGEPDRREEGADAQKGDKSDGRHGVGSRKVETD